MIDLERIQRLAERLGNRKDSLEIVRQMRCGGKKYPDGGKFFRTNLQNESSLMYQPIMPSYPDVPIPVRYEPEPNLGQYEYPSSTGMAESFPVTLPPRVPVAVQDDTPAPVVVEEEPVIDLFSDEAKARRRLKQRYAESKFNDSAVSDAGAMGAWQIMPITLKDYLGRGRGKQGDINNAEYNGRIRDWVMSIIPRDLQEFWSEDDSDINKLAKLYAAYNWGAGSLRNYLRKRQKAGKSIDDPYEWVEGLNPETKRYVKYLAFDEDFDEKTGYTTKQFEDAARAKGYMADGGRLFEMGGPEKTYQDYLDEYNAARSARASAMRDEDNAVKALREYQMNYRNPRGYWYWTDEGKKLDAAVDMARGKLAEARKNFDSAEKMIGEKTLEKYAGTANDPMYFWEYVADTKDKAEKYYKDRAIRESTGAKEVADYFNSYANSPGYQRIRENQRQWWVNRHPYRKIWQMGTGTAMESTDWLQDKLAGLSPAGIFDISTYPELSVMRSGNGHGAITVGTFDSKEFPYWFTLPHEMAHISNTGGYATSTLSAQKEALDQNVNTEPGHDSRPLEKHSDKEALMFLLYKEGIYDSRGEKDCTPEDIAKLREKYPNLRPLLQMDDEKAAWMINHVADAGEQESLYDNHLGNISANGGKIRIKPENRGKFTALKKRTGHSASWFKAHGTPAQKKMAVFALNAKKWKHGDGGPLDNYFYDGGPYGVIPLGGDYLTYLQTMPEVSGGMIEPSVATAALPSKFNGSQVAAARYAEGYQKGAKPVSEAISRAGQDIFNTVDTVVGLTPTPAGAISWLGHMGADAAEGEWGKVGRDAALALALGAGARGVGWLKNYVDDATNFGEDVFRAFTDRVPGRVSTNFTYAAPATRAAVEAVPVVANAASAPYEIENLGGGYMLKSLMRGNPLEKQISKNGTVNVNNVRALVGKGSKVEQAVVDKVLASEEFAGKKSIDYNKFRKAVQDELITYERTPDARWATYGEDAIGFRAGSPTELREINEARTFNDKRQVIEVYGTYEEKMQLRDMTHLFRDGEMTEAEYDDAFDKLFSDFSHKRTGGAKSETYVFSSSRIPNGSAKHYNPNTLGHSRTYTTADEPDVLHVMESQSDWAQEGEVAKNAAYVKDRMQKHPGTESDPDSWLFYAKEKIGIREKEVESLEKMLETGISENGEKLEPHAIKQIKEELLPASKKRLEEAKSRFYGPTPQEIYLSDNFTSRQIQENLRYAAEKGQTKMRYPTRKTAAKIEGYPGEDRILYFDKNGNQYNDPLNEAFEMDPEVASLRAQLNKEYDNYSAGDISARDRISELTDKITEMPEKPKRLKEGVVTKTITTYRPEHEGILKKYDAFPKQFKKLYKNADVRTITDPKGNTWYEVDVPENYLQREWAYEDGGSLILPKMMMDKHSPDKLRKAIANIKAKRMQ